MKSSDTCVLVLPWRVRTVRVWGRVWGQVSDSFLCCLYHLCKRSDTERGELPSSTNLIASNFSSNVLLRIWTVSVVSNFVGSLQYVGSLFVMNQWCLSQWLVTVQKLLSVTVQKWKKYIFTFLHFYREILIWMGFWIKKEIWNVIL